MKRKNAKKEPKSNALFYGVLAGVGLLVFYLLIVSLFQGFAFALLSLRTLWYWIFPLAAGFGTQIGLYNSIQHTAKMTAGVAVTGTFSGGSMVACCSHFVLNLIPLAGMSALSLFLLQYQKLFLGAGLIANIAGIALLIHHKRKIKRGIC